MVGVAQRYRKFNRHLRQLFGGKVYRVGLCGGFTCPNRDGRKGLGGCTFCNPASNQPLGYVPGMSISEQLVQGIEYVRGRHGAQKFIAYFSDYTTTYAEPRLLASICRQAIDHPDVVGLTLSTRPDCLSGEVLDLLESLRDETMLWIELGLQSAHDRSLQRTCRHHTVSDSRRAISRLQRRGISVCGHVILGLPGESQAEMLATADFLSETGVDGAKIHGLHVIAQTPLAEEYRRGDYVPLEQVQYVDAVVRFLERLPPRVVIQRLTGEAPRRLTVAPVWSVNKLAVFNAIVSALESRDTWQGKALGAALEQLQDGEEGQHEEVRVTEGEQPLPAHDPQTRPPFRGRRRRPPGP
jgi:radical SAM protein (TIGR01212 family)